MAKAGLRAMVRHGLLFGLAGGALVALLRWTDYRFLVVEHSEAIYAGLIAAIFAAVGVWLGWRFLARRTVVVEQVQAEPEAFVPDAARREALGITLREMEVLGLVAEGLSNKEIAERLFVSENTVKTHCGRAFGKLGAQRRTQAVQRGKELGLLR